MQCIDQWRPWSSGWEQWEQWETYHLSHELDPGPSSILAQLDLFFLWRLPLTWFGCCLGCWLVSCVLYSAVPPLCRIFRSMHSRQCLWPVMSIICIVCGLGDYAIVCRLTCLCRMPCGQRYAFILSSVVPSRGIVYQSKIMDCWMPRRLLAPPDNFNMVCRSLGWNQNMASPFLLIRHAEEVWRFCSCLSISKGISSRQLHPIALVFPVSTVTKLLQRPCSHKLWSSCR